MVAFIVRAAPAPSSFIADLSVDEVPISQGGKWNNGLSFGSSWHNMQTVGGKLIGATNMSGTSDFTDNVAQVKPSFFTCTDNQYAEATIWIDPTYAASATGSYTALVRWNGPVSNFNALYDPGNGSIAAPATGDVMRVEIASQIITLYRNGVSVFSHTALQDGGGNSYAELFGNPGCGSWPAGGSHEMELHLRATTSSGSWQMYEILWGINGLAAADRTKYGFSSFKCGNL